MEAMVKRESLERYFSGIFGPSRVKELRELGSGAHGTGYSVTLETAEGEKTLVLKSIAPEGLGHDYPSDRAAMHLLAMETFGELPAHVRALDVLAADANGEVRSIGGGKEYFLLMEQAEGTSYFEDLKRMGGKDRLDAEDRLKISAMVEYLGAIHASKKYSRHLYLRKIRDIVGHGECLMGVFDLYPEGVMANDEMAGIEKMCVDWRARLKQKTYRLSQIHGDFHPGNIWFHNGEARKGEVPQYGGMGAGNPWFEKMRLLDRSRGPWGDPADDVTALTINYVFFSIKRFNELTGAYLEALRLFYTQYMARTADRELLEVAAPFYAFRGAVVACPVFYPEVTPEQRGLIFRFVRNVLEAPRFDPERAPEYLSPKVGARR